MGSVSARHDNDETLGKSCATIGVNDMVVSDDDSATVDKTSNTDSPSTDNSSYSGSDDETVIESEQPLFLDTIPPMSSGDERIHHGCNSGNDALLGCNVGVESEDDAMMADFLNETFGEAADVLLHDIDLESC